MSMSQPLHRPAPLNVLGRLLRWLDSSADANWQDPQQSEAWNTGYRAYFKGRPNPYMPDTASYREWESGYDDAHSLTAW